MNRVRRPSPALAVAVLALFLALGGSALAVGKAGPRPVVRCGNGSVKGFAAVNLDFFAGAFPTSFSGDARVFAARYSCSGASPQARSLGNGTYEVRFPGVPAKSAVVSAFSQRGATATWWPGSAGSFRVQLLTPGGDPSGSGFSIAVY